jgi:hypothetical protein
MQQLNLMIYFQLISFSNDEQHELHTFMIMPDTSLAINAALRIGLAFTWKYISLTVKQLGSMT